MKRFSTFRNYVDSVRGSAVAANSVTSFSSVLMNKAAAAPAIPKEGITSVFSGHHLYAMLLLRPSFTTSSVNEDRKKHIRLIARLAQGVRKIVHEYYGALLEVQGPVVHAFIPNEDGSREDVITASFAIQSFIADQIRADAADDFIKGLVAFCHGPTIFVASEDTHGDNSIVSLAPAANAPAKVLWNVGELLSDGSVLEVETDGISHSINRNDLSLPVQKLAKEITVNCSRGLPAITMLEANAMSVPPPYAPNSPTVEEPLDSYSISFRADMDGFTSQVAEAFEKGEEAVDALALRFLQIMRHARSFCTMQECVHLPWAGDCFNLLVSFEDRENYQAARKRRILEISKQFHEHMKAKFLDVKWAFSHAAGELENAQVCNTLVSRITVGHTTLLLATGLPVERSLNGLTKESPMAGSGVFWKEDVAQLDADLQNVLKPCPGGKNHRHFSLADLSKAMDKHDFQPTPKAYVSTSTKTAVAACAPLVRPYAL